MGQLSVSKQPYLGPAPQSNGDLRVVTFRSYTFTAREATELTRDHFSGLGLNPNYFRPGITRLEFKTADFQSLLRAMGIGGTTRGAYLPSAQGNERDVLEGLAEKIEGKRSIALPENYTNHDLIHELAHDILMNGSFSIGMREGLFRQAILEARGILNTAGDSRQAHFIRVTAQNSLLGVSLADIKQMLTADVLTLEQRVLAAELFAYSLDGDSSVIPKEIRNFIHAYRIKIGG